MFVFDPLLSPNRCQDKVQTVTVINVYCPRADPEKPERKQFKLHFYKLLQGRAEAILKDGRCALLKLYTEKITEAQVYPAFTTHILPMKLF